MCWPDPFPHEQGYKSKAKQPVEAHDQVYNPVRFHGGKIPYLVYIPRAELMFKIMRACLGVTQIDQLWIYNDSNGNNLLAAQEDPTVDMYEILHPEDADWIKSFQYYDI